LQFYFLLVKTFRIIIRRAKTTIVKGVQDAEDRLNEEKRLSEAEKQLNQANIVISEKNETVTTKKVLLESEAFKQKRFKNLF
jgi:hypothetical protein